MGVLERAFVPVRFSPGNDTFQITPAIYQPFDTAVEADWSQAAFWCAAQTLGSTVRIRGMENGSFQGDRIVVAHAGTLSGAGTATIDLSNCPDLLPPLAVMAALRRGDTRFVGAARLRLKESDRLSTVCEMLTDLGGEAEQGPDTLTVHGVDQLSGGIVDGANDHRIVMAAAIAATRCRGPVVIRGGEAVKKSYPGFWREYERLGGDVRVL